jgi:NAD(P)-dependent dehydrogenase (short-subunit alcohol dehydrogenase family)
MSTVSTHPLPEPPSGEGERMEKKQSATHLGTTKRLPEFNLVDRVVLVSGAARGLGLTQAEALLEAGATVYALDILPEPSPDFPRIQKRAAEELGTTLHYRHIDVRDNEGLNKTVKEIADAEGRMDGLIAAAGIQKETSALEYTQEGREPYVLDQYRRSLHDSSGGSQADDSLQERWKHRLDWKYECTCC